MNARLPYHLLNTIMIFGGVGMIFNMLNLVDFLMRLRVQHFLFLIAGAVIIKMIYGTVRKDVKDPMTSNQMASRFFYLGMAILASSLLLRNYDIPYYQTLLYLDIPIQIVALGISYSVKSPPVRDLNEDVLDL